MKALLPLLVLAVGCKSDDDAFPVLPGGNGNGGTSSPGDIDDAGVDTFDGQGLGEILARVCLVDDLRFLANCSPIGAGNITVTLGTKVATTENDGRFAIELPFGSNLVWRASGTGFVTSVVPFAPDSANQIPILTTTRYGELLQQNTGLAQVNEDQGSIVLRIIKGNVAAPDVTASSDPPAVNAPRYDGLDEEVWDQDRTGTQGLVWIAGQPETPGVQRAEIRIQPAVGNAVFVDHLIEDQAITFASVDLGP